MSGEAYELLAMLMRYIFALIGALILFRAYRWLRRDAKAYRREMRTLPDAGLVGEIVNLMTGESQPLPREGDIGSSRECDIRVKGTGIGRHHARFAFEEGKGLRVTPVRRARVIMAGVELRGSAHALHGTQLQIGDATLRVRLFAGLNVPHPASYPAPDAILESGAAPELWTETEEETGYPLPYTPPPQGQETEYVPYDASTVPPAETVYPYRAEQPAASQPYDGNFTDDGQMTWQYAYSLEELRRAQEAAAPQPFPEQEEDEAVPYQSPLPRRRRRSRK